MLQCPSLNPQDPPSQAINNDRSLIDRAGKAAHTFCTSRDCPRNSEDFKDGPKYKCIFARFMTKREKPLS